MSGSGRIREIRSLVRECGLEMVDCRENGGGHLRVVMRAPNGATRTHAFSKSPSDARSNMNDRAVLRRFARENNGSRNKCHER